MIVILHEEQALGADIAQPAAMPNFPADVLRSLSATGQMWLKYAEIPLSTTPLDRVGLSGRICGSLFGNAVPFGAGRGISAPGRIGIREPRAGLCLFHGQDAPPQRLLGQ